jgi:hypothetical protein
MKGEGITAGTRQLNIIKLKKITASGYLFYFLNKYFFRSTHDLADVIF